MEEDTPKIRDTTGTVFIKGPSIVLLVWRCIMFNGSYLRACLSIVLLVWRCIMFNDSFLRVCRILWFVKKLDFPFLSLGGPSHGARLWCLGRVPKFRNLCQEVEGLLFSPKKLSVGAYLSFCS